MRQTQQTTIEFPEFGFPPPERFLEQVGYHHGGRRDRQDEGRIAGTSTAGDTQDPRPQTNSTATNGVVQFKAYAHLVSIDPGKNRCRFYTLAWQPALFGGLTLVRSWGRIGTSGRSRAIFFGTREEAQKMVDGILKRRLRHGYAVVRWE